MADQRPRLVLRHVALNTYQRGPELQVACPLIGTLVEIGVCPACAHYAGVALNGSVSIKCGFFVARATVAASSEIGRDA